MNDQAKHTKDEELKKGTHPEEKKENDDPALIQDVIDQGKSFSERAHKRTHVSSKDSTPKTI